jgi:hypothetical protein
MLLEEVNLLDLKIKPKRLSNLWLETANLQNLQLLNTLPHQRKFLSAYQPMLKSRKLSGIQSRT